MICQSGSGSAAAARRPRRPGEQRQDHRVQKQALGDPAERRPASFDEQRAGDHDDRKVDRDEQEQRHRALLAIGFEDQRDADEDGVRLPGGKTRDHRLGAADVEESPGREARERPDDGDGGEIGDPVAPGLHRRQLRPGERAEDQARHGEGENEVGQALTGRVGDEPEPPRRIAEPDQAENRKDDRERGPHRASAGVALGEPRRGAGLLHQTVGLVALALELGERAPVELACRGARGSSSGRRSGR